MISKRRICLHYNNQSVVAMINNSSSKCKNCMYLIRAITLKALECNTRVFATYINTKSNDLADALSRDQMHRFWQLVHSQNKEVKDFPEPIPSSLWPVEQYWQH